VHGADGRQADSQTQAFDLLSAPAFREMHNTYAQASRLSMARGSAPSNAGMKD